MWVTSGTWVLLQATTLGIEDTETIVASPMVQATTTGARASRTTTTVERVEERTKNIDVVQV